MSGIWIATTESGQYDYYASSEKQALDIASMYGHVYSVVYDRKNY